VPNKALGYTAAACQLFDLRNLLAAWLFQLKLHRSAHLCEHLTWATSLGSGRNRTLVEYQLPGHSGGTPRILQYLEDGHACGVRSPQHGSQGRFHLSTACSGTTIDPRHSRNDGRYGRQNRIQRSLERVKRVIHLNHWPATGDGCHQLEEITLAQRWLGRWAQLQCRSNQRPFAAPAQRRVARTMRVFLGHATRRTGSA
jgi:hypothetical protein